MAKRSPCLTAVFDTETTDLSGNSLLPPEKQPHIFEFCAIVINEMDKEVGKLDFLCKPGGLITEDSTRVTGVKNEDVADLPPFSHFANDVAALFRSVNAVAAHNLSFDMAVVGFEMDRLNIKMEWPIARICTVENTEHLLGRRMKLIELHEHLFGVPFEEAHKARIDTEALTRCFIELRKRGIV